MKLFAAGIGESAGDSLVTGSPLYVSGDVWYVHSGTGTDAVSPAGKTRYSPLATLEQALTNAADGDAICLLAGHTQTVTSQITISERLVILGAGTGASRPKFTRGADIQMIAVSGARVQFRNVFFEDSTTIASSSARVSVSGANARFIDCYFECGGYDEGPAMDLVTGGDGARIDGCTFISVATALADRPAMGMRVANAITGLELVGAIFDGGAVGWTNQYAFDGSAAAITDLRAENISLLRDSDIGLHASTVGYVHVGEASSSARVVW